MGETELQLKKSERSRHIYRLVCGAVLIGLEALIFIVIWLKLYNPHFRNPYVLRGNYFVTVIYILLSMLFNHIYGGLKLGYYKTFNIIFSLSMTALITNVVTYIAVVIPAATLYVSPVPAVISFTRWRSASVSSIRVEPRSKKIHEIPRSMIVSADSFRSLKPA